ncbi:hypothetical protein [Mesonia aquimarina]|uniref:hypothetical protein n=1 Tax=Mesonia aquimarina TaxID=1504967 RepID=UPI000EF611D7|nr:hypothetical protein [Mesonia aquimarina]
MKKNCFNKFLLVLILCVFFCGFTTSKKYTFKNNLKKVEVTSRIYTINSTTTNEDLVLIEENLQRNLQGTSVEFSEIKRNKEKELTHLSISTKFKDENTFRKNITLQKTSAFPIKLSANNTDLLIQHKDKSITAISKNGVTYNEEKSNSEKLGENPLYIFNGKKLNSKNNELLFEAKDGYLKITTYNPEEAIARYGNEAKEGAIRIEEVKSTKFTSQKTLVNSKHINAIQYPDLNNDVKNSINGKTKPLFFINGKKATGKEINQLEENNIEKVVILKDKNATKKYGEKGKNGVVEITLKK